MNGSPARRNRLTPWYVGLVLILAAIGFVGYRMATSNCAPVPIELGVLVVVPVIYLVLMYLTFVSQK